MRKHAHHSSARAQSSRPLALAVFLALANIPFAQAGDILRGGSSAAPQTNAPTATSGAATATAARARANAADTLARTTQALQSMQAMQATARKIAIAGPNNLGRNPNFPNQTLPNVTNGLGTGGLKVAPGVPINLNHPTATENANLWTGAKLPTQTVSGGKTKVTIVQTQSQAILNWETFNIGKKTSVTFDQTAGKADAGKWIAFNKINDPSGNPTQILGSLDAIGQVYLINQNGILFGGSSQVNLHNLTASSLPINDNLIARGLLNNPDAQFLFTALLQEAGSNGTPGFTPPPASTSDGRRGDIIVNPGARLSSPTSADNVGGRIVLIGPNVTNGGTISTPDGQTILAAGLQVGMVAHSSKDPSLRGLDVYVGAIADPSIPSQTAGAAVNSGLIEVPRANLTITGSKVHQSGGIDSSTSVALNGSIVLNASYNALTNKGYNATQPSTGTPFLYQNTGTVSLDQGSAIQILPDLESQATVVGTELALRSSVEIRGLNIYDGAGSILLAPNATVSLLAGEWSYVPSSTNPRSTFIYSSGQIYLAANATIRVAGSDGVQAPVTQNILTLQLRGSELADSPLQRTGLLRSQTLTVDIRNYGYYNGSTWVGSPLGNVSGYAGLVQRDVGQLTVQGGDITLAAGGSVVMQPGSQLDVAGGWTNFAGGMVGTTRVQQNGYLVDISNATPDLVYSGIYTGTSTFTYAKYGITETFSQPLALTNAHYEPGYLQGAHAGSIVINAPSMALDGQLTGGTVTGDRQLRQTASISDLPKLASLTLRFNAQQNLPSQNYPVYSPTPPTVVFKQPTGQRQVEAFDIKDGHAAALTPDRVATVQLSPDLLAEDSFGSLTVENLDGEVLIPTGTILTGAPNSHLSLSGANISVSGSIRLASGSVNLSAYNISPSSAAALQLQPNRVTPQPNSDRGNVRVASGAVIDTSGLLVNDRPNSTTILNDPAIINGGQIQIESFNAYLDSNSVLDVSGGAFVSSSGSVQYGNAGKIRVLTGQDQSITSVLGGKLELNGKLRGFSGNTGGELEIRASQVQIGGSRLGAGFWLPTDFFDIGGFQSFTIRGIGAGTPTPDIFAPGLKIADGTQLLPSLTGLIAVPGSNPDDAIKLIEFQRPPGIRPAVNLAFEAIGAKDVFTGNLLVRGDLDTGLGSTIAVEPSGSVSLKGNTVTVSGSIIAPGGSISVSGASSYLQISPTGFALPTVFLAPGSLLSARGTTVLTPDPFGRKTGSVLPGGRISISGNIVAAARSILDVSGASDMLDIHPANLGLNAFGSDVLASNQIPLQSGISMPLYQTLGFRTQVESAGGHITFKGAQELFVDSTLRGSAGGPTALGGTLEISSGRFISGLNKTSEINLTVQQSGPTIPISENRMGIGEPIRDSAGAVVAGMGYFAADTFLSSGFDSLSLNGNVKFSGTVNIHANASLRVATGGIISADAPVSLSATYVALGQTFRAPLNPLEQFYPFTQDLATGGTDVYNFLPTYGSGALTVRADLIDVGVLSLQNIGRAQLLATHGSIRGNGSLDIAGNLTLQAGQIYPVTASAFAITAYDYSITGGIQSGSVTVLGGDRVQSPLSAGGRLSIYASKINQGGVLLAPLGSITLGWDGSGTAPKGYITAQNAPIASSLILGNHSITSVSGSDAIIPYGLSLDGNTWIDPRGVDITGGGVPAKTISMGASNIDLRKGAVVDLQGGGDLYAYRWVHGIGGTQDILASNNVFAVIPGYDSFYSPYSAFNTSSSADSLNGDPGYLNTSLSPGDRVFLQGSATLKEGVYTLLPARYALLPGAVLVTPKSPTPIGTALQTDGSNLVGGYRFSSLNSNRTGTNLFSKFEVASSAVFHQRAEYADYLGNAFLVTGAQSLDQPVPRLPVDAGQLVFQATQSLQLNGSVFAQGASGGRGGLIDIGSPTDIVITAPGRATPSGVLVLNSASLSRFGAESLLIGGTRQLNGSVATVTTSTGSLTVDNAGSPLQSADIILVAKNELVFSTGANLVGSGPIGQGVDQVVLTGNGLLARVSADQNATVSRTGVTPSPFPHLVVGMDAQFTGGSIILDSSDAFALDPGARIKAISITLNSGQISLALNNPGAINPTAGLVIEGAVRDNLAGAHQLSLLSYSTFDIYGSGNFGQADLGLAINAGQIRGFNTGGGMASFTADSLVLGNHASAPVTGIAAAANGSLVFNANTIFFESGKLDIDQFDSVLLSGIGGILARNNGALAVSGSLTMQAPVLTLTAGVTYSISSTEALAMTNGGFGQPTQVAGGLGGTLNLQGASVALNSNILLSSGLLDIQATTGNLSIGGTLDVAGTAQNFYDVTRYTDAGQIVLSSSLGNVILNAGSLVNVSAPNSGGNAGTLTVNASVGSFSTNGKLMATGGAGGNFQMDVATLPSTAAINSILNAASFSNSRVIRVRAGDVLVDGQATSSQFKLFVDQGSITVTGTVDASGAQGGEIDLSASGSVLLSNGALLDVSALHFNSAGKGGEVHLEAGSEIEGVIDSSAVMTVSSGSTINLSVKDYVAGSQTTPGSSAFYGKFTGTLNLRAPLNATMTDLAVSSIDGTVIGASRIGIEGYKLYDLTASDGAIDTITRDAILSDGSFFGGNYTPVYDRLLASNPSLQSVSVLRAGAEIINRSGDLTLDSDWNLSTYRFGTQGTPGVLTLRAKGDLIFQGALSDGFDTTGAQFSGYANEELWLAPLMAQNLNVPVNTQSYDYRLTAGADLTSANHGAVLAMSSLMTDKGNLLLGKNASGTQVSGGRDAVTASLIGSYFQVIRTGSGNIDIMAARDVQLLNPFASIYTAGTAVQTSTTLFSANDFVVPIVSSTVEPPAPNLGAKQQDYFAQYSLAGGNVSIQAGQDITRMTRDQFNNLIPDSSRQMPTNWLYRRGYVDPVTGQFGASGTGPDNIEFILDSAASTSWWVDFSNFFQDIGTLGGGNVSLVADRNVANVSAVAATNARMSRGTPDASKLVELGGGNVTVRAGQNIDAGVYYVQRGQGSLVAGGSITTNMTRSPSLGIIQSFSNPDIYDSLTWLPTTLFVGDAQFNVSAQGDVLLGPVTNPFILPQGINNKFYYKTYFFGFSEKSSVNVSSLGGNLTLRESAVLPDETTARPILEIWYQKQLLLDFLPNSAAWYQPWLRLTENTVNPFRVLTTTSAPNLKATIFSGDINTVGTFNLFPSPSGSLQLLASGSINGLNAAGLSQLLVQGQNTVTWTASSINLSDASPDGLPGITTPFAYVSVVGLDPNLASFTNPQFLDIQSSFFQENGSTEGVLQTKQTLHATGLLHTDDANPVQIYSETGNISGFTLYTPKETHLIAGNDITDIGLYFQNLSASDTSIVSSGRDIVAYNANSPLRVAALSTGNGLASNSIVANSGDIQISGPGSFEVFAGRNLDLGTGSSNSDGTGTGITSIGNSRNPYLGFDGANILTGAGLNLPVGLATGSIDFDAFLTQILKGPDATRYLSELELFTASPIPSDFNSLAPEERARLGLQVFFLVLRDAGRDFNDPLSPGFGTYSAGDAAVAALFPVSATGNITTQGRNIRTKSGGAISILAPSGSLTLANSILGNPLTPPGIITEAGGNISIFTDDNVDIGIGRIFTLRGGNEIIWSSTGNIAAGSSSKTVQSAPPTRVLIDPQSGDVATDLAGLATGGGIGVLATVAGILPGDVDLIAPTGSVDAGDAGIRATGNLNIAAVQVLNADNIQAAGTSIGVPVSVVAAPNLSGLTAASNTAASSTAAASDVARQNQNQSSQEELPSIIIVEVLGYGG